jgi:ABC-type transport system substrate-binding protein
VRFEANGTYFKKRPQATSLVMKKVIDPIIRMNELRRSRINLILETSPLDRPKVEKMSRVDIESFLPYAFYQVAINTRLFSNADARKAMSMALDRANLVPAITNRNQGVVLNYGPFPSDIFARNIPEYVATPVPNLLPYDEKQAKALAESSGLSGQTAILLYPDSLGDFGTEMARSIVAQLARIGLTVEAKRTGDQVFKRMVFSEKSYELALLYCDGFDNLYSSLDQWFYSRGKENISGVADATLDKLLDEWGKAVVTEEWVDLTLRVNRRISELAPAIFLCTLQKDVYSRGLKGVAIATDNPFLSIEDWSIGG